MPPNFKQENSKEGESMLKYVGMEAIIMIMDRSSSCLVWRSLPQSAMPPKRYLHAFYVKPIAGNISVSCEL